MKRLRVCIALVCLFVLSLAGHSVSASQQIRLAPYAIFTKNIGKQHSPIPAQYGRYAVGMSGVHFYLTSCTPYHTTALPNGWIAAAGYRHRYYQQQPRYAYRNIWTAASIGMAAFVVSTMQQPATDTAGTGVRWYDRELDPYWGVTLQTQRKTQPVRQQEPLQKTLIRYPIQN